MSERERDKIDKTTDRYVSVAQALCVREVVNVKSDEKIIYVNIKTKR